MSAEYTAEDDVAAHNRHDERWGGPNPATCDDLVWWELTGMCGGCGTEECHDGPCGSVETWHSLLVCDRCTIREAQGLVRVTPPATTEPGDDA